MAEGILCHFTETEGEISCNGTLYHLGGESEGSIKPTDALFWVYLIVYIILVLFAGLMSGLTMGLLSLDIMSLEVLKRGGKPREKKYASRIIRIVKKHHLLLVTLLLANAIAVESMPIFLDKITNEIVAILISVTAVLVFGEIVPQALCTRFGLAIGYYCAPLVYFLMAAFFILAFPISKVLDLILGKDHSTFFRRAELKELVQMHGSSEETDSKENEEPLSHDEILIVKGALDMRDKTVKDAMTPLESVFMLHVDDKIGQANMEKIIATGHSRIPIYKDGRSDIVGLILVKKLIILDPDDNVPIKEVIGAMTPPPSCSTTTPLYDILNQFQTGRSHLYLVYNEEEPDSELVGIITLEDVIEELIGEEIVDETDLYVDVHQRISVARARVNLFRRQNVSDPTGDRTRIMRIRRAIGRGDTSSSLYGVREEAPSPQALSPQAPPPRHMESVIPGSLPDEDTNEDPSAINSNEDDKVPLLIND
ncbi:PREDICTED: DUF21 domain-containing protein At4g14230-like [Amphimedon queenslandica]|uniref:CNNM transmembrane domain-containing protein n=1 Tax=Amphimedon queenslandica TaxID=400682 RepID=A0A1X7VI44_AMPQE|nr:PREDICTED: DUF21 domain-containing protein At4g14230-like [Amphimedon queenslandica]|eukprot:XP_019848829.1 PREDICTED: DUF21 domain-containing protein At4g14230-like [Amphimedon queenslandica]